LSNRFSVKKLLQSKWTATNPVNKEKHFIVTDVEFLETGEVSSLTMEAVMSRRSFELEWRELKDGSRWRPGWK